MKEPGIEIESPEEELSESGSSLELGSRLKAARESKGLAYGDIVQITRLRPQYLEAIEREDWASLPSPALARGFINTYARALGLDGAMLMSNWGDSLPVDESPLSKMVPEPRKRRVRPVTAVLSLLAVVVGVGGFMLWNAWNGPRVPWKTEPSVTERQLPKSPPAATREKIPEKPVLVKPPDDTGKTGVYPAGPEVHVENSRPAEIPVIVPDEKEKVFATPAEEVSVALKDERSETPAVPEPVQMEETGHDPAETSAVVVEPSADPMPFILKADIRERTWMRITVDDGEPREYIFPPGRQPEWQAREGFDLLIGNAGGLVLEINGKNVGPLGASGQVVRVRLPKTPE